MYLSSGNVDIVILTKGVLDASGEEWYSLECNFDKNSQRFLDVP